MHTCVCVCVCVCVCACVYIRTHTHTHAIHIYIHTYIQARAAIDKTHITQGMHYVADTAAATAGGQNKNAHEAHGHPAWVSTPAPPPPAQPLSAKSLPLSQRSAAAGGGKGGRVGRRTGGSSSKGWSETWVHAPSNRREDVDESVALSQALLESARSQVLGGKEGARERAKAEAREGARERGSEGARKRGSEGARERGSEGARERGSEGARE